MGSVLGTISIDDDRVPKLEIALLAPSSGKGPRTCSLAAPIGNNALGVYDVDIEIRVRIRPFHARNLADETNRF
jgi:hypothetical protein